MRIIVLSKNRAAQAEALLRSIKEQARKWEDFLITVFYDHSDKHYEEGYSLLKKIHPQFHYCRQDNRMTLNEQLNDLIAMQRKDFFCFFVDDLVVIRSFGTDDRQFRMLEKRDDIMAVSLRLNPRIDYCQPKNLRVRPPAVDPDGVFQWQRSGPKAILKKEYIKKVLKKFGLRIRLQTEGDWEYQMIMDGNVFRFDEFKKYFAALPKISYVPQIEPVMVRHPLSEKNVIIYPESRIINIASNKVAPPEHVKFPCAGEDAALINDTFLNGGRLSYAHLKNLNNTSCHIAVPLRWEQC